MAHLAIREELSNKPHSKNKTYSQLRELNTNTDNFVDLGMRPESSVNPALIYRWVNRAHRLGSAVADTFLETKVIS